MSRKYFNIAGPCHPNKHYMLAPLRNIGKGLTDLIEQKHYFVIHAARQSGKTTLLLDMVDKINAEGKFYALYCSLEGMQNREDIEKGIPAIIKTIKNSLDECNLPAGFAKSADFEDYENVLKSALVAYCRVLDKPLIIFFDEADCLSNGTLISFLRQLRSGFITRARTPFVHSIALVGMRNIRDYKASIRPDSATLGSSSPFNIVTKNLNLKNFTKEEIIELYNQHTQATEQVFEPQAVDCIFEQTQGQPWLVNAIAREAIEEILQNDYSRPVTAELAQQAIHNIVLARGTHFDSLMERLKEPRVRNVMLPMIMGEELGIDRLSDDFLYTRDLGLIRSDRGKTEPANPIYAELIVRALNYSVQEAIKERYNRYEVPFYLKAGKLDINALLKDFQNFWCENSEIWIERYKTNFYQYDEAAPHLVIQAFLQRVVNGGGDISREMALGKMRSDICVEWQGQKYPIELKILRNDKTIPEGLEQLSKYMSRCGADEGWLVVFDRDMSKNWDDKLYVKKFDKITVFGC